MQRAMTTLLALTVMLGLAGCSEQTQEVGRAEGAEGVASVLDALATSVPQGDGARVCSLMSAAAQRRLESATGAGQCLAAVDVVAEGPAAGAIADLGAGEIAVEGGTATVAGAAADALADLLDAPRLRLERIEERWVLA